MFGKVRGKGTILKTLDSFFRVIVLNFYRKFKSRFFEKKTQTELFLFIRLFQTFLCKLNCF